MFKDINQAQWLWYFYNFQKDDNEEYEYHRNFVEYLASFSEPAVVKKIRAQRDSEVVVESNDFGDVVKNIFGRALPGEMPQNKDATKHNINLNEILERVDNIKFNNKMAKDTSLNYKHWADFDME